MHQFHGALLALCALVAVNLAAATRNDETEVGAKQCAAKTGNILFVGNPGVGKSTILNSLMGKRIFRSGVSYGKGLTDQLYEHQPHPGSNVYMDTPGLSDASRRREAAHAITKALRRGGLFRTVFVITLESGRLKPDDLTTIKLVLDAAPITSYGIIINKLTKNIYNDILHNPQGKEPSPSVEIEYLLAALPQDKQGSLWYLKYEEDLDGMKNALSKFPEGFQEWVHCLPAVHIDPAKVNDIKEHEFQSTMDELNQKIAEYQESLENAIEEKNHWQAANADLQASNDFLKAVVAIGAHAAAVVLLPQMLPVNGAVSVGATASVPAGARSLLKKLVGSASR